MVSLPLRPGQLGCRLHVRTLLGDGLEDSVGVDGCSTEKRKDTRWARKCDPKERRDSPCPAMTESRGPGSEDS